MPSIPIVGAAVAVSAAAYYGIYRAGVAIWENPAANTGLRAAWKAFVPG